MANRDRDSFDDYDTDDQDDGFLTFDAREEDEDRGRGPLIIVGIVLVLALIAVVGWQVYNGSRETGETPQVAADTGSFKAAADPAAAGSSPGGDVDKGVFDAASGAAAPALDVQPATTAETPMLTDGSAAPAAVAPVPAAPAPAPAPAQTTPPPRQVAQAPKVETKPVVKPAAPETKPAAVAKAPAPTKAAAPAPAKAATPPPAKAAPAASGFAAQLGSFKDKASADSALAGFRASGLTGPVAVVPADLGAKGTWYRIRVTGFSTRSEVDAFCVKARSAGAQCIPAAR